MKTKMIVIIILLSIAAYCEDCLNILRASQPIVPIKSLQKLQTGHFSIENAGLLSRYRSYKKTFSKNHDQLRVGVSLSILLFMTAISFIQNYLDRSGIDFSVRPIVKDTYFTAFFAISARARWATAHIHYIVSSRQDLVAGFILANDQGLLETSTTTRTFTFKTTTVGMLVPKGSMAFAKATICGIKIQQLQVDLKIVGYSFNLTTKEASVSINVYKNLQPIQLLYFSYVGFVTGEFFVNDGNENQFNYIFKVFYQKKDQTGLQSIISLLGINGTQIKKLFNLKVNTTVKPNTIAGAAAQKRRLLVDSTPTPTPTSTSTSSSLSSPLTEQNLLPLFGNRTLSQLLSDPTLAQIGLFDSVLAGQVQYSGTTISQTQMYQSSFLVAEMGSIVNSADSQIITSSKQDILIQDIQKQPNLCVSQEDCISVGGKSIPRDNGKFICLLCKAKGQIYYQNQQKCKCLQGFILKDQKQCVPINYYCAKDEEFKDGLCYKNGELSKTCDFVRGYVANNQKTKCICSPNLNEKADQNGEIYCVKDCKSPLIYSFINKDCQCPGNTLFIDGKCTECPLSQVWDQILKKCRCKDELAKNSQGQCSPCSPNAIFNKDFDKCECKKGFTGSGFYCSPDSKSGIRTILVQRRPL